MFDEFFNGHHGFSGYVGRDPAPMGRDAGEMWTYLTIDGFPSDGSLGSQISELGYEFQSLSFVPNVEGVTVDLSEIHRAPALRQLGFSRGIAMEASGSVDVFARPADWVDLPYSKSATHLILSNAKARCVEISRFRGRLSSLPLVGARELIVRDSGSLIYDVADESAPSLESVTFLRCKSVRVDTAVASRHRFVEYINVRDIDVL